MIRVGLGGLQEQGGQGRLRPGDGQLRAVDVSGAGVQDAVADPHRPVARRCR